jgi:post-segregation antitoxin (ccd killing protein)
MTQVTVSLPDELAQRARNAGLLSDSAIRQLLEEAMRREAGRKLLKVADQIQATNIAPMSDEAILAEVKAVRAAHRANKS